MKDNERFVALTEKDAVEQAEKFYGKKIRIFESGKDYNSALNEFFDWATEKDGFTDEEYWSHPGINLAFEYPIWRDPDVLDTWFSSGLWPFSTLGWPANTGELARFFPTSTLVTAFDIIFFWVARMMMQGLHFMDEVPFKDCLLYTSDAADE